MQFDSLKYSFFPLGVTANLCYISVPPIGEAHIANHIFVRGEQVIWGPRLGNSQIWSEEKTQGKMGRRQVRPKTEMGCITGLRTGNLYLP